MGISKVKISSLAVFGVVMVGLLSGCTGTGVGDPEPAPTETVVEENFTPAPVDEVVPADAPGIDTLPDGIGWEVVEDEGYYQVNAIANEGQVDSVNSWFAEVFGDVPAETADSAVIRQVSDVDGFDVMYSLHPTGQDDGTTFVTVLYTEGN